MKVLLIQDNGGSLRCYGPFEDYNAFREYSENRKSLHSKPSLLPGDFILQEVHPLGKVKSSIRKENTKILELENELWILKRENLEADVIVNLTRENTKLEAIIGRLKQDHIELLSRYEKLAYK